MISGPVSRENITEMIDEFKPDLIVSMGWTPEHSREKQAWIRKVLSVQRVFSCPINERDIHLFSSVANPGLLFP